MLLYGETACNFILLRNRYIVVNGGPDNILQDGSNSNAVFDKVIKSPDGPVRGIGFLYGR